MAPDPRSKGASGISPASSSTLSHHHHHHHHHSSGSHHGGGKEALSASAAAQAAVGGHHHHHHRTQQVPPPRRGGPSPSSSSSGGVLVGQEPYRTLVGSEGYGNTAARHPLDPLDTRELREAGLLAGRAVTEAGLEPVGALRLSEVGLQEPDKTRVVRYQGASPSEAAAQGMPRVARVLGYGAKSGRPYLVRVDLSAGKAMGIEQLPPIQPRFGPDDYETCEEVVRSHEGFRRAMAKAGYDPKKVMIDPWSMGYFGASDDPSRRLCWALMYYKEREEDNTYARPVEGLKIVVDLLKKEVASFSVVEGYEECGVKVAAPDEPRYMNYTPPHLNRADLKDLVIVQPDGPSFSLRGRHLSWQGWNLRVGFTAQEGLVLHMISYTDRHKAPALGPVVRPVMYRLSFAEMVVPYGDPAYPHYKKNAFDGGEDGLGTNAHSLSLGCDCLGHIHYLDADLGPLRPGQESTVIKQAICIHEEDGGVLWKHKDWRTDTAEVRRNRKLVLSFMCTIGNYDYGFYYHLSLDGSIEMEVRLTGILSVGNLEAEDMQQREGHRPWGTTLHLHSHDPRGITKGGLFAPYHQHIFCARMDMAVDGSRNRLVEVNSFKAPIGPGNPHHSAWTTEETLLTSELKAVRDADLEQERFWLVQSATEKNRTGKPTAFKLMAKDPITVMAHPQAAFLRRAGFAAHTLWATAYDPEHRYPAGDYPNQDPTPQAGLPSWVTRDRPLVDQDMVLWHVFGAHHIPRLEDWPLMPAERVSCMLKPFGFFDACPVMDVAPSTRRQLLLSTSNNRRGGLGVAIGGGGEEEGGEAEALVVKGTGSGGVGDGDCCGKPTTTTTNSSSTTGGGGSHHGGGGGMQEGLLLKSRL